MKTCRTCQIEKPLSDFYWAHREKQIKCQTCIDCMRVDADRRYSSDPFSVQINRLNAYAKRKGATDEIHRDEWELLCILFNFRCARCNQEKILLADHVIPISKGGTNTFNNAQPLCRSCNSKKQDTSTDYRDMVKMEDEEIIRQAMSVLGKRKSERKTAAQKVNIAHAATFRQVKPCNCGSNPHKSSCPVYVREAQRKHREKG